MLPICYAEWWLCLEGSGNRIWLVQPSLYQSCFKFTPPCRIKAGKGSRDVDSPLGTVKQSLLPLGHRLHCTWPGRSQFWDRCDGLCLSFYHYGYWPSNPPHTEFCTHTETGLQDQLGPITLIHLWCSSWKLKFLSLHLFIPMQTQRHLYINGF